MKVLKAQGDLWSFIIWEQKGVEILYVKNRKWVASFLGERCWLVVPHKTLIGDRFLWAFKAETWISQCLPLTLYYIQWVIPEWIIVGAGHSSPWPWQLGCSPRLVRLTAQFQFKLSSFNLLQNYQQTCNTKKTHQKNIQRSGAASSVNAGNTEWGPPNPPPD